MKQQVVQVATQIVLAALCFVSGNLAIALTPGSVLTPPIWPPTALGLAAILLQGRRLWPGVLAGCFLVGITSLGKSQAHWGLVSVASLVLALGSTAQALIGGGLVWRYAKGREAFAQPTTIFLFAILAGVLSTALSAAAAIGAGRLVGSVAWPEVGSVWFVRWLTEVVSAILLTPPLVLWVTKGCPVLRSRRFLEAAALIGLLVPACGFALDHWFYAGSSGTSLNIVVIPFLVWSALRFGPLCTALVAVIIAGLATGGALHGHGPFVTEDSLQSLLALQNFVVLMTLMALMLAAAVAQREEVAAGLKASEQLHREAVRASLRAHEEILKLNTELEERVQERTAQLETINKELEAFSYSVSHDLRSPLRSIRGFSEVLLERYADKLDERGREFLRRVCDSSQCMDTLIEDLLKLSRVGRAELQSQSVDLSAVAQAIAEELRQTDPKRLVQFQIAAGICARGDERLLRIVLDNLLRNAWKFTSRTSKARIEFGQTPEPQPTFFVRDNGAGFDMAFAARLFGVFQRLHSTAEFPGTGVGLAIVQRIITRHGGRVWAEGAVDQGATFYFSLPHQGASESPAQVIPQSGRAVSPKRPFGGRLGEASPPITEEPPAQKGSGSQLIAQEVY